MKVCRDCKYFRKAVTGHPFCVNLNASWIDRVDGRCYPTLMKMSSKDTRSDEILAKCDKEGWFEEKRSLWRFW